ncbi:DEKNAAC101712 [Brettanomyces naardenensis]|uniref:Pre-mRNA-splicing factor ISY1 n=1 Tax=Brettanomyces naardenensis TaxID=13370 RepID=A0A448YIX6_BRENA|nr:DEKNAAC101712 [Brettanomyces naardenensis]
MSRNKEKAQSLLSRYYAQKGPQLPTRRPNRTSYVNNAPEAERYRKMCMDEINKDLMRINDILVNEYQIRDLNDELNKLVREKRAWEYRIRELGGPDYIQIVGHPQRDSSVIVNGYRYFGRAKELPDIQKLLVMTKEEDQKREQTKLKRRNDRMAFKQINQHEFSLDYYGIIEESENSSRYDRSSIPSEQELIDKVKSVVGADSLPGDIVTSESLKDLNGQYYKEDDDILITFERQRSRELRRQVEKSCHEKPLVDFDESFDREILTGSEIEKFIVERRKEQLLAKLKG